MMISFETFELRVKQLRDRVEAACARCGRKPEEVAILPVTKTHPLTAADYAKKMGFPAVGENRVQEAEQKISDPSTPAGLRWELIGHLQRNKARDAVALFDRIQTVDSEKLLRRLEGLAAESSKVLPILIQVNAGDDPAKFGISLDAVDPLMEHALQASHLIVDGLMTIAPLDDDPDIAHRCFARLREKRDRLAESLNQPLPVLSMGMTGDLEAAVAEGSTQIRVGTALFGSRE